MYHFKNRAVPWKNWDEWKETYKMLYSANPQEILLGCSRVSAWEMKQELPIAIEVTATLQRELNNGEMNVYALSLGIIRFINGVVEPFKNVNLGVSISSIGASYGVPDFVVTLRHSATHGRMPTFEFASIGAKSALEWLKDNYWEQQLKNIMEIEQRMKDFLMNYFLKNETPFENETHNNVLYFGINELVKIALNSNQTKGNIKRNFQESVSELLNVLEKNYKGFTYAFVMKIAEEVAKGNEVASVWLEFFHEKGLVPIESISLLFQWSNPSLLGKALPMKLLQGLDNIDTSETKVDFSQLNNIEPQERKWFPISIGSLPLNEQSYTMTDEQYEYVEPCDDIQGISLQKSKTGVQTTQVNERENTEIIQKTHENLLEIW